MYLRATLIVLGITGALVLGVMAYARLTSRTAAGATTMPPDWPVKVITVPASATDVAFAPDLRQFGSAAREVGRRLPSKRGRSAPFSGPWQIYFNDARPLSQVFGDFEQPLLAAGYVKGMGRDESQIATVGLSDRRYDSADGKYMVQVRYWAAPPRAYGGASQPQHWVVMIQQR